MEMAIPMVELTSSSTDIVIAAGAALLFLLMLLLIFLLIIFACKPWRFVPRLTRNSRTIKVEDIERPLVSEDSDLVQNHSSEFSRSYGLEGASQQTEGHFNSTRTHGLAYKHRLPPTAPQLVHSDSFVLNISDETLVGQTLKRPLVTSHTAEKQNLGTKEDLCYDSRFGSEEDRPREFVPKYNADQRSILMLEVISGPSRGLRYSIQSTNTSELPLTLGRVSPSALLLNDNEVSGKHALINWNLNKLKWELVDMGSLNGTLLNSQAIHLSRSGSRHWGDPTELASGDIITVGTTSKISIEIASQTMQFPFGVGVASDPMSMRRGGKKLPMEDVCYYQWPLHGAEQFGMFGICDGHGGAAAAISASKFTMKEGAVQIVILSSIIMTVFFCTRMEVNYVHANKYLGALFYSLIILVVNGFPELSMTVTRLAVFYKQRELCFYPAWGYAIPAAIIKIPLSLLEAVVWVSLTYYVIGYIPEPGSKGRVLSFSEKPKGADLKAMAVDTTVLGLSREEAGKKPYIASIGVYVFKKEILLNLLRWRFPTANDFGSEIIPASAREFFIKDVDVEDEHDEDSGDSNEDGGS